MKSATSAREILKPKTGRCFLFSRYFPARGRLLDDFQTRTARGCQD
jgi:hypothetical protein